MRRHRYWWATGAISALVLGATVAASQPVPAIVLEAAVVNAHANAGIMKAGTLCLPSGRLHVSDFIAGNDFKSQVQQALALPNGELRTEPPQSSRMLKIDLEGVEASLCARKYGMFGLGDRQSMSGAADFHFAWSAGRTGSAAVVTRSETIHLEVRKNEAKPAVQFLSDALNVLARRIVAAENGL